MSEGKEERAEDEHVSCWVEEFPFAFSLILS